MLGNHGMFDLGTWGSILVEEAFRARGCASTAWAAPRMGDEVVLGGGHGPWSVRYVVRRRRRFGTAKYAALFLPHAAAVVSAAAVFFVVVAEDQAGGDR